MTFDLIIKNANIITLTPYMACCRWLAIKDGKILLTGENNDFPSDAREIRDYAGFTILPGFIDSHVHGSLTGEFLNSLDLSKAQTVEEILHSISVYCKSHKKEKIISVSNFSESNLKGGGKPSAAQLDEISSDQIIVIYDQSLHGCILNTKGLAASKVSPNMAGVEVKNGKMTGLVSDDTSYYFSIQNIMSNLDEQTVLGYMNAVNDFALSKGVTTIHSLDGGDFIKDMPTWITHKHLLDINVVNYWETLDIQKAKDFSLPRVGGCICLDGTRIFRTMALNKPYSDQPTTRGILYYKNEDIYHFVGNANQNGMQCSLHAAGERAIDQYIRILDQVIKEQGNQGLRHRIEHFSLPTQKHIEMAAELQLALSMQPSFAKEWDEGENSLYKQRFGKERASRVEPIGKIVKAGGKICGGSDSPVTLINPLRGIDACVHNPDPSKNISIIDALNIFTQNGAWAAHEEAVKGTIEKGKFADLVVLDKDPLTFTGNYEDIQVMETIVKGKTVFCKT